METQKINRRIQERTDSAESLFVQIVASNNSDLIGTTVSCSALDRSSRGMRITSKSEIPAGSKLDIWIDVSNKPGKFFLTSDVKWSKADNHGQHLLGVEFGEGATTDIAEWRGLYS